MSSAPVIVVGAGIAGVACARELHAAGVPVRVLDRASTPGGRMASPRQDGRPTDIGAAYFTVRDDAFAGVVDGWRRRGLVRPWTDALAVRKADGSWCTSTGPHRWAAADGLRFLVTDLAAGLTVTTQHTVQRVGPGPTVDGEPGAAVVLAMPDPQAAPLLDSSLTAARAAVDGRQWEPMLALVAVFGERCWHRLPAAFVNGHEVLALIADDGERRGDGAPVLVAHSTPGFAAAHRKRPEQAGPPMVGALIEILELPNAPRWARVHRWDFARPAAERDVPFHLDDDIGLAGDGWGRPRVETAWRSGHLLGRALAARFS